MYENHSKYISSRRCDACFTQRFTCRYEYHIKNFRYHLSFTVSGDDLGKILELSAKIRDLYPDVKLSVSNGNCKISVFGEAMKGQPGVAAKVFAAAAKANTDIIMITTSEVDISMLVPQSDLTATLESIKGAFNN